MPSMAKTTRLARLKSAAGMQTVADEIRVLSCRENPAVDKKARWALDMASTWTTLETEIDEG
jgi:hypothetical protein